MKKYAAFLMFLALLLQLDSILSYHRFRESSTTVPSAFHVVKIFMQIKSRPRRGLLSRRYFSVRTLFFRNCDGLMPVSLRNCRMK